MGFWNARARLEASRLNAQGDWLVNAGQDREAVERFTEAIAADPRSCDAYRKRSLAYYALAQYADALNDFNKCIAMEPKHPFTYLSRGTLYLTLKDYQHCIQDCTMVLSLLAFPSSSIAEWFRIDKKGLVDGHRFLAHLTIAHAELQTGNFEAATAHCAKAIAVRPDEIEAFEVRAQAYKKLGRLELAEDDLQKVIQLKANSNNQPAQRLPVGSVQLVPSPAPLILKVLTWLNESKLGRIIHLAILVIGLLLVLKLLGLERPHFDY